MGTQDLGLFGALFDRFQELIGDSASVATFKFAAQQEGKRLGESVQKGDVVALMAKIDSILGHESTVVPNGRGYELQVAGSAFLSGGQPVLQGILIGLLEGAFQAACNKKFEIKIQAAGESAQLHVLEAS